MSRKRDTPEWAKQLGGVRPLPDRDKRRAPDPPPAAPHRPRTPDDEPVVFTWEAEGEALAARAPDVARAELRRLRRGGWPVEREIDLHGMDAASAERETRESLAEAQAAGVRCVLVIHGRGRHSEEGAVLKRALPDWLAAPPTGPRVLAFASATPHDGGPGATYVLLRKLQAP